MTFFGLNILQWVSIIGIPSIFTIIGKLYSMVKVLKEQMKQLQENTDDIETMRARQQELITFVETLMTAQQAQMRKQLLDDYHEHRKNGYISDDDLDEWINQYNAYHSLGANGVLDARKEELLKLPVDKKQED